MSILCDFEIRALAETTIFKFAPGLIRPGSLEVRLGSEFMLIESSASSECVPYPFAQHDEKSPYFVLPGQMVIAQTYEIFNLPPVLSASFQTWTRFGTCHAWLEPGHEGPVQVLIKNPRQLHSLPIWPEMELGQIVFYRMSQRPLHPGGFYKARNSPSRRQSE